MIYKKIIFLLTILVTLSLSKNLPENDTITNKLNLIPSTYREMRSLYHSPLCISLIDNYPIMYSKPCSYLHKEKQIFYSILNPRNILPPKSNLSQQQNYDSYLPKIETKIEKQEEDRIIQYHILPTLERILPLLEE